MATTATLNGGPTGGLHATPTTLIHTDNPPPEETCRVDSNSSFESGHEESHIARLQVDPSKGHSVSEPPREGGDEVIGLGVGGCYDSPSTPTNNNTTTNTAYFLDLSEASSKKRRKQSRPVRIPLDPSDEAGQIGSSLPFQKEGEGGGGGHEVRKGLSRSHVPLNLSSGVGGRQCNNDQEQNSSCSSEGEEGEIDAKSSSLHDTNPHRHSHTHIRHRRTSFSENDKTDEIEGGQAAGTKDSPPSHHPHHQQQHHQSHRMRPSNNDSPSSSLPQSFSPGLFPLGAASPFSSLFSANLNLFAQQQQQQIQQGQQNNPGPAGTPTSSSSAGSNSGGLLVGNVGSSLHNMPPHRIFNPEAYCDLCNKEFCNKYFLKTHKANKHGVYSEMSPSLGMGQVIGANSSSSNTSFLTGAAILSSAALAANCMTNAGPSFSSAPSGSNNSSHNNPSSVAASLHGHHNQNQGDRGGMGGGGIGTSSGTPNSAGSLLLGSSSGGGGGGGGSGTGSNNLLGKGTGGSAGGTISSEVPFSLAPFSQSLEKGAGNSNGSQQRESFCELCQKEFCNKYFLKRHKAKIHGIPVDSHSSTGSGRSSSSSNHGKSSHSHSRPLSNGGAGGGSGGGRDGDNNKGLSLRELGLESLGLEIVAKHLEDANRASHDLGGREEGELSGDDETREKPDHLGESDDNSGFRLNSSMQQQNQSLAASNEENSCQFCLRDFSSKQHLINHLVKKHRLMIPSSFPPFLFPFPALFEDPGVDGTSPHPLLLDNNNANNGDGDFECSICNRSFQTVYLLRMHKSYFHPDSHQDPHHERDDLEEEVKRGHPPSRDDQGIMMEEGDDGDPEQADMTEEFNSETENSNHGDGGGSGKGSPPLPDDNNGKRGGGGRGKDGKKSLSIAEIEGRGDATSDSDDLRRLQTMIMELNRVSTAAVAWSPPIPDGVPSLGSGVTGGSSATYCGICNKEFYSTYFLQQHIQHFHAPNNGEVYHGIKSESPLNTLMMSGRSGTPTTESPVRIKTESLFQSDPGKKSDSMTAPSTAGGSGGITISPETLKERLLNPEAFGGESSNLGSSTFLTPGPKGGGPGNSINNNNSALNNKDGPKRPSPSLSRSYCTICHKELCNKYFMRTHMLKMHGISIESSTGLGGVTCDICNKELCSKYFLKVHKQNTHGIVEDGPSPPNPNPSTPGPLGSSSSSAAASLIANNFPLLANPGSLSGLNLSTNSATSSPSLSEGASQSQGHGQGGDPNSLPLLPKEAGDLSSRYFCHYSEVCPFCGRRFRSPKWLKTHLQQDHGEEGRERWKSIERSLRRSQQKNSVSSSNNATSSQKLGSGYPHGSGGSSSKPSSSSLLGQQGHNSSSSKTGRENRVDGNKCAFCTFSTGDVEIMKSHLIKEHSSQLANRQALSDAALNSRFQEAAAQSSAGMLLDPLSMLFQKMDGGNTKIYRCAYCPFTTSILVYLFAHERTHTGLNVGNQLGSGAGGSGGSASPPSFQCPMCFHAFDQPDAFQQHLIGHQMSGVLAPFFTPSATSVSSGNNSSGPGGRLGFLSSPSGGGGGGGGSEADQHRAALLSLPMLNGSAGDNLYWALKNHNQQSNNSNSRDGGGQNRLAQLHPKGTAMEGEDEGMTRDESNEPPADLTTEARKKRAHEETNIGADLLQEGSKKREKGPRFRCSYCQSRFPSRDLALAHVHQVHGGANSKQRIQPQHQRGVSGTEENCGKRFKNNFRCRKCKFTSATYQMLVVHNKLQHSAFRPTTLHGPTPKTTTSVGTSPSNEMPEGHGVAQESGQFLMQGFLLTSSEEENSNHFVPSVVYLPVREKVSQSIRVSFSLTPTSASEPETTTSTPRQQHQQE